MDRRLFRAEQFESASNEPAFAIAGDVIEEDKAAIVVNKPPGLVVHPGAGNPAGTLQNALLHFDPKLAEIPRGGIVHRLDKDTSGAMVVAKTLEAHTALVAQLSEREVNRRYIALVNGTLIAQGEVVVVNDKFGIRLTDIITPAERIRKLRS